ncbi:hypothetical protein ACFE04_010884 [Oxalis oulophora]
MKWDMETEEMEAVLEKIWDLHDKLSDTIHSISRSHYLRSLNKPPKKNHTVDDDDVINGFVFVKEQLDYSTIHEAKSLDKIRTALENLEDHLDFLHTVQTHQRAERDAAIARLEQSRIILAMRLAEHHGKDYKVIQEALAFIGDVDDSGRFVSPENLHCPTRGNSSKALVNFLVSSFNFAKTSLHIDNMGGILGNAAVFAVSLITLLHLHQAAYNQHEHKQQDIMYVMKNVRRTHRLEDSSSYVANIIGDNHVNVDVLIVDVVFLDGNFEIVG